MDITRPFPAVQCADNVLRAGLDFPPQVQPRPCHRHTGHDHQKGQAYSRPIVLGSIVEPPSRPRAQHTRKPISQEDEGIEGG